MGTGDQVREFVGWMLRELEDAFGPGTHGRWSDAEIWAAYNRWMAHASIMTPVPHSIFLKALAKHPQVSRKRDLVLDSRGRSIPNPSGRSKKRDTFYTIRPPRKNVMPGTVPVGELVPKQVVPTKSQRAATKAAQPQPLPKPGAVEDWATEAPLRKRAA